MSSEGPVSYPGLLDWPHVHKKMPWGMLLMVGAGAGFAMAIEVSPYDSAGVLYG